jgi:asparagine synthase (glutamine-hydrolysing)
VCGICGYVAERGGPSREELERMNDTMRLRGPDDRGIWLGEGVGLGHRRLSIIDLSPDGRQPMGNEDGTVQVVFNGEIYNFGELRGELEARGHRFRSRTDTEVIPHAYEEWGDLFARRLRGMFAIGLWDDRRRRLLLVRDRLGKKPLYHGGSPGCFLFASELKPFTAWPGFTRELDPEALAAYLAFGYVPAPLAIWRGVRKLPAAHLLVREGGAERLLRYWDPLETALAPRPAVTAEEAADLVEDALEDAVRLRLVSDVPLGAFLSGGIDSSLVVATMARLCGDPVRTFTIGYWERSHDESAWAGRIAAHLGTRHTSLTVEPREALELIPHLPEVYDEPFGDASAIPTCLVSRLARREVTVALSGDGGDELFGGYPRYRWFSRARPLAVLPPSLRRLLAPLVALLPHPKAAKAASWLAFRDPLELYFGLVGIWRRGALHGLLGRDYSYDGLDFRGMFDAAASLPPLERLMLTDLVSYLPEDILTKVDRASMAHSLEARAPLLDHRLVELALSLPLEIRRGRGEGKLLLRTLLARRLPPELFRRPKMGFGVPLHRWFRGELRDLLRHYLEPDRLRREGLFDPALVGRMVGEHLEGRADHQYTLWVLLSFALWRERHG